MSKKPTSIRKAKKQASLEAKKLMKQKKIEQQSLNTRKLKAEPELSIYEAYEILGGYIHTFSQSKYAKALEMVMAIDPDFAKTLDALNAAGKSFKTASSEDIATAEEIALNAKSIHDAYADIKLFDTVIADPEIDLAFENTPVYDSSNTCILSGEEARTVVFHSAQQEIIPELAEDPEFSVATPTEKKSLLVDRIKNAMKRTLFRARIHSLPKSAENFRNAFNFKNKIKASMSFIANTYEKAQKSVSTYISKLAKNGKSKAATWLNKAKTRVHSSMVKLATASIVLSSLLPSCKLENGNQAAQQPQPTHKKTVVLPNTTKTTASIVSDSISTDSIQTLQSTPEVKMAADSLIIPTEWNDSLGISKASWTVNQTFFGNRAGYENAYNKITDEMLEKSGFENRDQFLNAYRVLRSYYPNVIDGQGDVLAQRSETSEKFSKFFHNDDCIQAHEFTNEDFEILQQAPQLTGTLNRRSTQELQGKDPCDPGKVQYVKTKKNPTPKNVTTTTLEFEELGQSGVIDTVPQFDDFNETGSSRLVVTNSSDTLSVNIDVFKGNTLNDGKHIGAASAENIVTSNVSNKKDILVEKSTMTFAEEGKSTVVSDSIAAATASQEFTFAEEGKSTVVSDSIAAATASQEFTFAEEGKSTVVSDSIATAMTSQEFTFAEEGKSTVVTSDITSSDSIQVVLDSDELPIGTPSAGYVPERGGVNNSGLTEAQIQYSKSKIINEWGESAYDDLMEGISDDMLSKGNIFEGLTKEQAIYNLSVWSTAFPHSYETTLIYNYVLNCHQGETMSADDTAKAKAAMDRIRISKTIDGVVYNKPIYVKTVTNKGCDENVQVDIIHHSRTVSPTAPFGPKFPRLFGLKNKRPEPITFSFDDEFGRSHTETQIISTTENLEIHKFKGNTLNISESIALGDISADDLSGVTPTNKKDILVENYGSSSVSQSQTFSFDETGQSTVINEDQKSAPKKVEKKKKVKKSKKQIEQEALEMARQDYLRLQKSSQH